MKTFINKLNLLIHEKFIPYFDTKITIIKNLPEAYHKYIRMHRFIRVVKDEATGHYELSRDVTIPADIPLFSAFKKKRTRFSGNCQEDIQKAKNVISKFVNLDHIEYVEFLKVRINNSSITCVLEFELLTVDQSMEILETVYVTSYLYSALQTSNDHFKKVAFGLPNDSDKLIMVHKAMEELETILCKICRDLKYHDVWIKNHAAHFSYVRATNLGIAIQFINRCFRFLMSVFDKEVALSNTRIPIDILSLKFNALKLEVRDLCRAIADKEVI